jgi:hypothetical protein
MSVLTHILLAGAIHRINKIISNKQNRAKEGSRQGRAYICLRDGFKGSANEGQPCKK